MPFFGNLLGGLNGDPDIPLEDVLYDYPRRKRKRFQVKKPTKCKYCDSRKVYWKKIEGNWRLYNGVTYDPHICIQYIQRHLSLKYPKPEG